MGEIETGHGMPVVTACTPTPPVGAQGIPGKIGGTGSRRDESSGYLYLFTYFGQLMSDLDAVFTTK